jgi:hypothetical protein
MTIGGVSSLISAPTAYHPILADALTSKSPSANAALKGLPPVSSTPSQGKLSANNADRHSTASSSAKAAAAAVPAANPTTDEELVSGYSATVGDDTYSASVDLGGGQYTASIANLIGATATATTEQSAETELSLRIDTLV